MGGEYFDLPDEPNDQFETLMVLFEQGAWRYSKNLDIIKQLVNENF